MKRVITYGTFDMLHYGHIRLLERAKALGDYLIVGITSDDYDKTRGKINVSQSLMERIEGVRATGIADQIIIEEYPGQKIDDIQRLGVDIFTVGSDWKGKFDYLNEYCQVIYLERTQGISSSEIRTEKSKVRIGLVGDSVYLDKFYQECSFVNGAEITAICTNSITNLCKEIQDLPCVTNSLSEILNYVDAVYIVSHPNSHYEQIKFFLENKKHILCESPSALKLKDFEELKRLAEKNKCIFLDSVKTAFSTAYSRLLTLVKSGVIGDVISVDATCTSLHSFNVENQSEINNTWSSIFAWGHTALLPVFNVLGTEYTSKKIITKTLDNYSDFDLFTKIDFVYLKAVASIKVGKGIKSEGELIISGTKGYVFVPAPWWKTDYFEIRFENPADNKRYFYQLDGEGIRYEIVSFVKQIEMGYSSSYLNFDCSSSIVKIIQDYMVNSNDKLYI